MKKSLDFFGRIYYYYLASCPHADVAELADALDSGSSRGFLVQVQVLSSALLNKLTQQSKDLLSFFVFLKKSLCSHLPLK